MKSLLLALLFAPVLQSTPPPVRTVAKGPSSEIAMARTIVVRSDAEWVSLWKEHGGGGPAPEVDFSREMVVGIFQGVRPTAGYGVEIVRAIGAPNALIVEYRATAPSRDSVTAQVLTAPYHLAAIPREDGEVTFRQVER
jgi:hypothetical protein